MNNNQIRQLIINLLDDEDGVNDKGYTGLYELAEKTGNKDIMSATEAQDGRWFLGEDDAAELRKVVVKEETSA